jgi:enoyl-[acyl-carrier-protein] reductase (NADH)
VFGQNPWTDLNPVSLLDYEGMELIFIGVSSDIVKGSNTCFVARKSVYSIVMKFLRLELGIVGKRVEETAAEDVKTLSLHKILHELDLHRSEKLTQPLLEGEWK